MAQGFPLFARDFLQRLNSEQLISSKQNYHTRIGIKQTFQSPLS